MTFLSGRQGPNKIWYCAPNRQRVQEYKIPQLTKITLALTMGRTPRQRQLTGCRCCLPMQKVTTCSCGMHLSHAKVGFRDFLQSLFAVTCHLFWTEGDDRATDDGKRTAAAAKMGSGGGRRRRRTAGGGGLMRCKGEEDIGVSFPRIPMYAYTSSTCYVYAHRNSIPGE
jgi:hypothetical protein